LETLFGLPLQGLNLEIVIFCCLKQRFAVVVRAGLATTAIPDLNKVICEPDPALNRHFERIPSRSSQLQRKFK